MVHQERLAAVLSEFARTLGTDFPIQGILDHLVGRIVDVLPITAAGVSLISPGSAPRFVAASDDAALRFERLQTETGEGPCLLAHSSGEPVTVPDLSVDDRFPVFATAALSAGLAAVFSFPLRNGDESLGALDLYRDEPGRLSAEAMAAAQTLADVTGAYLLNAEARQEAARTTDRFRQIALHDSLTGLPNRLLLHQRLEHAAHRAQRSHNKAAIIFVDLDQFKRVNDTYGHQVGDELLHAVSQRLSGLVRPGDTLARFAGDEFVFLCEDLNNAHDVEVVARRIDEAFKDSFVLADAEVKITASVGVAFAGPGEAITEDLLAEADIAMYRAKRRAGDNHRSDLRQVMSGSDQVRLASDLRLALEDGLLDLMYQPIVRSEDGLVTGVEALLRWTDAQRGAVPAVAIVSVAEQSALITEIGAWVLERSCRDHDRWPKRADGRPLDLAVNVSRRQLMAADFTATVTRVLDETGMDPAALVLDTTEYTFIEDSERAITVLTWLKDLGLRIALDDFGTGYSSLSYLRRLPIDIVKIDQGFIADIEHDQSDRAIAAAVTNLAHVLGLIVTAEGVETEAQRDEVATIGCDLAQGYFYAHPMSAAAIASKFRDRPKGSLTLPAPRDPVERAGRGAAARAPSQSAGEASIYRLEGTTSA